MRSREVASSYKAPNRKSAPRWRGPAKILDVGDTGATAKFQSPTFKVARYSLRKNVAAYGVEVGDWNSASGGSDTLDCMPSVASGEAQGGDRSFL